MNFTNRIALALAGLKATAIEALALFAVAAVVWLLIRIVWAVRIRAKRLK